MLAQFKKLTAVAALTLAAGAATSVQAAALKNYGAAPEFAGIEKWLNSDPLTVQQLKGKPVLVEFWTYTCINCFNTLPYVKSWHQKYKDQGLVVVGVHTPEYGFERSADNVRNAIKRYGIQYPVAQDNRYTTWTAYNNNYWPAIYLIDKKGQIVYKTFGEGNYAETEAAIRTVLAQ